MSTALATQQQGALLEQVLISGDLSKLSATDRVMYYKQVCESVGLNPLTKPFEYITLNGKLTLYALRSCTEQLRQNHGVSVVIKSREVVEGCYVVTAQATDAKGRHDESIGAVPIDKLQGEARSNAMMKAETKAKRRVTLSICGLGIIDETEVDSIPNARYPSPLSATAGALSSLPVNTQEIIVDTAMQVKSLLANNQAEDAYAMWQNSGFDNDQKVAFWSQLDSKQRGVLGRMLEAEEAHNKGVISPAMHKRLEARIKEAGADRQLVKDFCKNKYNVEHLNHLTKEQYAEVDANLTLMKAAPQVLTDSGPSLPQPADATLGGAAPTKGSKEFAELIAAIPGIKGPKGLAAAKTAVDELENDFERSFAQASLDERTKELEKKAAEKTQL